MKRKIKAKLEKLSLWMIFLIMLIASFIIALLLIPLILFLNNILLITFIAIISLSFGIVFFYLFSEIQYVEKKHHYGVLILIFLFALVSITASVYIATTIARMLDLPIIKQVYVVVTYLIFFILPSFLHLFFKSKIF